MLLNQTLATLGIAIFIGSSAFAEPGFYSISDVEQNDPAIAAILKKASRASVRFRASSTAIEEEQLDGTKTLEPSCSAQFISNDGYLITALHCLKNILINHPYRTAIGVSFGDREIPGTSGASWVKLKNQSFKNLYIKNIAVALTSGEIVRGPAKIILLGKGHFYRISSRFSEKKVIEVSGQDFAILKFNRKTDCVKMSKDSPRDKDTVISIGYPNKAWRSNGYSSDGISQYFSFGIAVERPSDFIASFGFSDGINLAGYDNLYSSNVLMGTSLDTHFGSSGGMVLNQSGNLVGIAVISLPPRLEEINPDLTMTAVVRTEFIYDRTKKFLGTDKANEIFNCNTDLE